MTSVAAVDFECVELSELVVSSASLCEALTDTLELKTAIEPGIRLQGVSSLLGQLCINLIQNAIKYSAESGTITVTLSRQDGRIVLQVQDTGAGIAPEHQASVFRRFFQVDASRGKGSGLGLSIVRWIVELHRGEVSLESELGVGTTVTVKLPASAKATELQSA